MQLLKEASTEPSSDGYRRFFKLKGYSLLYTGGERLNHERFIFNCTLVSTAGHLSRKYWNVEELSKKLEGAKEISKEEFIKWATEYQQRKINNINSDYTQFFKDESSYVIYEGYHSYKDMPYSDLRPYYRTIYLGKIAEDIRLNNIYSIATFIVPKDSEYYENGGGEIVSSNIIYTGKYVKL